MNNNTLSLQNLFQNRIFRVPDYQRGYAWEEQQVGEFLDDLTLLDSSRRHYTGTIVLHQPKDARERMDNQGQSYIEMDVVDGQQRLTTTVLLLNEISRALRSYPDGEVLAAGIRKNYVAASDLNDQPLYKLTLNSDTDDFFKNSVLPDTPGLGEPAVESSQRLIDAKTQIAKFLLAESSDTDRRQWLQDLHQKITTRLHFNLYQVEEAAEVGIIFEVMNDRGKPLTELEKVKNYLLYAASSLNVEETNRLELGRQVNVAWADILRRLMTAGLSSYENENRLLRTHWIMQYDPQSRNWAGSKSIRREFDLRRLDHSDLLSRIHEYITGIRNSCISFCDALSPDRPDAFSNFPDSIRAETRLWSNRIIRVGVTTAFLPLLMAVRNQWSSEGERYLDLVQLCERLAFRMYMVAYARSNFGQSAMFHLAYNVAQGHATDFDAIRSRVTNEYSVYRSDFDEFVKGDVRNSYAGWGDWYTWKGIKYFLYEYEHHLALTKRASPRIGWEEIERGETIEHILPQAISSQPYWGTRFDEEAHRQHLHDIGNLMLTRHNSHYGNKSFSTKRGTADAERPCYANSPLFQEQEVAAQWEDWTAETIAQRRSMLLEWAKERWSVDFGDLSSSVSGEIDPDDEPEEDFAQDEGEE